MKQTHKQLIAAVQAARKSQGVPVHRLADAAGCSDTTLLRWLRGTNPHMSTDTMFAVIDSLGLVMAFGPDCGTIED